MAGVKVVKVGGREFHIAQADAEKQLDVYEDIAARLLANCASTLTEKIDINVLKGLLMGSPKGTIPKIADAFLERCFEKGSKTPVTITDFKGDIDNYVLLTCHGLMVNLSDFFISIESQVTELKKGIEEQKKQPENNL